MAQTVCVILSASDRNRLEAITSDRRRQRKHVDRARVVLASIGGRPVRHVAEAERDLAILLAVAMGLWRP